MNLDFVQKLKWYRSVLVSNKQIDSYQEQGAILLKGVFINWIKTLEVGIQKLMSNPSPRERSYFPEDGSAQFFQDLCNWDRIDEFRDFIFNSNISEISCNLMNSKIARFFHDHILVKEPGSSIATPWHQDLPYYSVDGKQNVSFWIPLDPIKKKICLKCISKSHLTGKIHRPKRFNGNDLYKNDNTDELPDIEKNINTYNILSWDMEPGDAIAFDFRVIHGAAANSNKSLRRRVFSARWVGEKTRFVNRNGKGSPPFDHLNLKTGDELNVDDFPIVYKNY